MKKNIKITSIALVFVMISTLFSFTIAAANKPEEVSVDFQISNIKDTKTLELGINLEAVNGTEFQSINTILEYDAKILSPLPWGVKGDEIYTNQYDTQTAVDSSTSILVGTKGPDEYSSKYAKVYEDKALEKGYVSLFAETLIPKAGVNERIITTRFAFNDGFDWYNVTEDTIKLAPVDVVNEFAEDAGITYFTGSFGATYTYQPVDGTIGKLRADNITFTPNENGQTADTGGSGGGGATDPSGFIGLNIYDWDDTKLITQVVPKGEDVSSLMPVSKPLPGYIFSGWTSRMIPELDKDGNPVLDSDGKEVMVRNQSTPNMVTGAPGVKYPQDKLVDLSNITENMDLIPAYDEDAGVISDTIANRRYTISRTPFVEDSVTKSLMTTVTVSRAAKTRRINHNNGTVIIRVDYNTNGRGTTTVFIEGGSSDEEKIDVLVSTGANTNYASNAVSITVQDYRSNKSLAFNIANTDCVIGK